MYKTKTIRRGTTAVALLVSAAAVAGIAGTASAAPTGFATNQTVSVSSGTISTPFSFDLAPGSNACPGDTAAGGYRVQTFIASKSVNLSTLTYNASGPVNPGGGVYTSPLYKQSDNGRATGLATAATTAVVLDSAFTMAPTSFSGGIPNGVYNIGIACSLGGATTRFWAHSITVSNGGTSFNWVLGEAPAAPVLGALTAGDTTLTGTFTAATADPAATYVVTTVPATVSTTVTPGTPFTLTGLTNLTAYTVKVTATNAVGSVDSNTQTGTPRRPAFAAPGSFVGTSAAESVVLTWTAPAGDSGRSGYTITSPTAPGSPFTAALGATTLTVTGLTANSLYDFTITANYTDPQSSGTPATVTGVKALANLQIIQDINVTRPAGALVLTQKCGVYGALDEETGYNGGFLDLPALSAVAAVTTDRSNKPTGETDARYDQYPYAVDANGSAVGQATYPTRCTINLSTAKLITTGARAGQYFTSIGRINQVTVVDTRDSDSAWNIGGIMSDFTKTGGGGSFSGNLMGWTPKMTDDSEPTLSGATTAVSYDQTVIQGDPVAPVQGLATGLKDGKSLGSAIAGKGLGIATLDARLKLLIPLTATDGTYTATLTFTSI